MITKQTNGLIINVIKVTCNRLILTIVSQTTDPIEYARRNQGCSGNINLVHINCNLFYIENSEIVVNFNWYLMFKTLWILKYTMYMIELSLVMWIRWSLYLLRLHYGVCCGYIYIYHWWGNQLQYMTEYSITIAISCNQYQGQLQLSGFIVLTVWCF